MHSSAVATLLTGTEMAPQLAGYGLDFHPVFYLVDATPSSARRQKDKDKASILQSARVMRLSCEGERNPVDDAERS